MPKTLRPAITPHLLSVQVAFEGGKVVFKHYMDDYPFPLYLVTRHVETLPEALADALRQWFELINQGE